VVVGTKTRKEPADLVRAGEARFIDKVEVLTLVWICGAGQEALQGSGFNCCLIQLSGGAGGRSEALNLIAPAFRGAADGCERGRLA
jgi:hypothetical protein